MSNADRAFEEDDNAFVLDQFNERAARQAYKMSMSNKADLWLDQLEPPTEEKAEKPAIARESKAGLSLSSFFS